MTTEAEVWKALLAARAGRALPHWNGSLDGGAAQLAELYAPLLATPGFVVAHLAQSLDGWIAAEDGTSRWLSGEADRRHAHRMRALCDAVLVGADTVVCDDPRLNVREVEGPSPVRVVIDPRRRVPADRQVFGDGARTLLVTATPGGTPPGRAVELVHVPADASGQLPTAAVRAALHARGLSRLFIEGGGKTVTRFMREGTLDRLQITVAPLFLGAGRPGVRLPAVTDLSRVSRPPARRFVLGEDVLFECVLSG